MIYMIYSGEVESIFSTKKGLFFHLFFSRCNIWLAYIYCYLWRWWWWL